MLCPTSFDDQLFMQFWIQDKLTKDGVPKGSWGNGKSRVAPGGGRSQGKEQMAAYGAISLPVAQRPQRRRTAYSVRSGLLAAAAGLASVAGILALASQLRAPNAAAVALQGAMRMNMVPISQSQMLCEGHFLDTATGIPEGTYSTLHHPGEMEGYHEPLPPEMRAEIDAEIYGSMVRAP